MYRFTLLTLTFIFSALWCVAQKPMSYFLPTDVTYDKSIPTPEAFFGQKVGEWHLTHQQINSYAEEIAQLSDRASMYEYARSYENRPLIHVVFTSSQNQTQLDELKRLHCEYSEPGSNLDITTVPTVLSLTYGVHGNESSASNSAVLTIYYLAAAQGGKIDALLGNTIILVDPCLNPDGLTRQSTWANSNQSFVSNGYDENRQFNEVWPGGRTNHYWFDLNRDYLLLAHPESRGRVAKFHEWKPNIVTDHHEMGTNSTFFFQPGVPTRNNPLTPWSNFELTAAIGEYHAKNLDSIGSYYFTQERFDDFYYGKGSSYPDAYGSVGILFEQARYHGRYRETVYGMKSLAFGIRNQFMVTLSTLEASMDLREDLLNMQKSFYETALSEADSYATKAFVFGDDKSKYRTKKFVEILAQHQIDVFPLEDDVQVKDKQFTKGSSFIVPLKQKQFRMVRSLFEEMTEFADTSFYDVSTWTMTHSMNLPNEKLTSLKGISFAKEPVTTVNIQGTMHNGESALAYIFRWDEYLAPRALYTLQNLGFKTKVMKEQMSISVDGKPVSFQPGSVVVLSNHSTLNSQEVYQQMAKVADETSIDFYAMGTGLTSTGIDLGSSSLSMLRQPNVLLFTGGSSRSIQVGEIWYLFDQIYKMPVTLSETSMLYRMNLDRFNTIVLTGSYNEWDKAEVNKLKDWVRGGGTLIVYQSATHWASRNGLSSVEYKSTVKPDSAAYTSYADRGEERTNNYIGGAMFRATMDLTHPLCYGYSNSEITIFKTGTTVAKSLDKKYVEPVVYTDAPYVSGWVSKENVDRIQNAPVVSVQSQGRGRIITYNDNMNFRGIWYGTNKLFMNGIFFGPNI